MPFQKWLRRKGGFIADSIELDSSDILGTKCRNCGSNMNLHIHHIDGDIANNDSRNLVLLCAKCHKDLHSRLPSPYRYDSRIREET
jgi:5-methylcytosine-specific restriction endonuclease McrA